MENLEEIRYLLQEVRPELMKKQNVVATGIGYKEVNGKTGTDLSIVCSVDIKKSKSILTRKDLVPETIKGLPTDVKPTGIIRAFQDPTNRFRPAIGGVSIGHTLITAGTFGCLVKKNDKIFILSNNHVIANSNDALINDSILQPGPHDGGVHPQDQIGTLSEYVPIYFEGNNSDTASNLVGKVSSFLNFIARILNSESRFRSYKIKQTENKVDAALAMPLNLEDVKNEILGIGTMSGTIEGELGMKVKKSGRTTGLTDGTIEQIDVTAQVSYGINKTALFVDQYLAGPMSKGGDSGSAVLSEDNKLVGLLFAGSDNTTLFNRIDNVFEELVITLP